MHKNIKKWVGGFYIPPRHYQHLLLFIETIILNFDDGRSEISSLSPDRTNQFGRVYRKGTALSPDLRQLLTDDLIKNGANTVTRDIPGGVCPDLGRRYKNFFLFQKIALDQFG